MSTAEDIRRLMQDVANAYEDRQNLLADLSKGRAERQEMGRELRKQLQDETRRRSEDVSTMLLDLSQERQEMSSELRSRLQGFSQERQEMGRELRSRLQDETRRRGEDVSAMLLDLSQERQDMGRELRSRLQDETRERQEISRELRSRLQDETRQRGENISAMLLGFFRELAETATAWQELVVTMQAKRGVKLPVEEARPVEEVAAPSVEKAPPQEVKAMEEAPPQEVKAVEAEVSLEDQVLKVISQYPKGIKLFDIGDHLGKDWRTFISAAKTLVEEGKVRKEDVFYYPMSS